MDSDTDDEKVTECVPHFFAKRRIETHETMQDKIYTQIREANDRELQARNKEQKKQERILAKMRTEKEFEDRFNEIDAERDRLRSLAERENKRESLKKNEKKLVLYEKGPWQFDPELRGQSISIPLDLKLDLDKLAEQIVDKDMVDGWNNPKLPFLFLHDLHRIYRVQQYVASKPKQIFYVAGSYARYDVAKCVAIAFNIDKRLRQLHASTVYKWLHWVQTEENAMTWWREVRNNEMEHTLQEKAAKKARKQKFQEEKRAQKQKKIRSMIP